MRAYLLRRLLTAVPVLLGISLVLFTILALAPGDPFEELATNPNVPPEVRMNLRTQFGLDDPVHVRYVRWFTAMLKGDWGFSFVSRVNVDQLILQRLPTTLFVLGSAQLLGLLIAGTGSRIAMRLIALADNREDFGRVTSAEAVVGDVTLDGTLTVLRTGVLLGILGSLLYLGLRRWLPRERRLRTLAFACTIVGLGLFVTVEGNQEDFAFLNLGLSLGLFGATLLLFGLAVPPLVDRLAPLPHTRARGASLVTSLVVALALVAGVFAVKHAVEFANGTRIPS